MGELVLYRWCGASNMFMWALPEDAEAPPPTPEEIAEGLYERIQGQMPDPSVTTSPPVGVDAIVHVPVFVTVDNWVDELVEEESLGGATVTVTAEPSLLLEPGVPGAGAVTCTGPGQRYDPGLGGLWEQASEACTFTYVLRTGVDGRPDQWASAVTVEWSISWSATSGESGTFPSVERSVGISRGVAEVQTIVTGDG